MFKLLLWPIVNASSRSTVHYWCQLHMVKRKKEKTRIAVIAVFELSQYSSYGTHGLLELSQVILVVFVLHVCQEVSDPDCMISVPSMNRQGYSWWLEIEITLNWIEGSEEATLCFQGSVPLHLDPVFVRVTSNVIFLNMNNVEFLDFFGNFWYHKLSGSQASVLLVQIPSQDKWRG